MCNDLKASEYARYVPERLLLQWHITHHCNLRCRHCYQDSYAGDELSFQDLLRILRQFEDLLANWRKQAAGRPIRAHITLTGGEPFTRADLIQLLQVFASKQASFSFAILTNGCFINAATARQLRRLAPRFVQVSIEGSETTHDRIRGRGNFARSVSALQHLRREGIPTAISFTAHRENYREFSDVARLGRQLRVTRVWADRLIPTGAGSVLEEQLLSKEQTREFLQIMAQARREATQSWFCKTKIAMHRALQFLVIGGHPYHCTAGDTLLTIMPNGDLYPCRRMPIRVGNLMETPLEELYYHSAVLLGLRDHTQISKGCGNCNFRERCRGGLKCLSYALTGVPFQADPGCWLAGPDAAPGTPPNGSVALRAPMLNGVKGDSHLSHNDGL